MTKNKQNNIKKEHTQSAKKVDWDDLAFSIIKIEEAIRKTKKPKELKSLKTKLKIYESEKSSRVFDSFDMQHFLSKDSEHFDEDYS